MKSCVWFVALLTCFGTVESRAQSNAMPLLLPTNIAADAAGNLYIAETGRHVVHRLDVQGQLTIMAGTGVQGFDGDGGQATAALLDSPLGLAVGAGVLYIADSHNHRVRRVDLTSGVMTTFAGGAMVGSAGDGGQAALAALDLPASLALDVAGVLYIADVRAHRVRRVAVSGVITTVAGTGTQGFSGDTGAASAALFDSPGGLAVDASGNLYVADSHNQRIRRVDGATGIVTTIAGTGDAGSSGDAQAATVAKLRLPRGLSVDAQGNLYVADRENARVRRIDALTGTITTVAGTGVQGFAGDGGSPLIANLDRPASVIATDTGAVVIADSGNARIREIVPGPTIQTIAGAGAADIPIVVSLSGASSVRYGSGQVVATLSSAGATGSVTFYEIKNGVSQQLLTRPIQSSGAVLDASGFSAGDHLLAATYMGDQAHTAAQSTTFLLHVLPVALSATVSPPSVLYGAPIPPLSASLLGVLDRDAGSLTTQLATTATQLSAAGVYPVTVTLQGTAAGNYVLAANPNLTISQAPTMITLLSSGVIADAGQPVSLQAHVASSTSGVPSGTISLVEGGTLLGGAAVDSGGDAVVNLTGMTAGPHTLTAAYGGDHNFLASASAPALYTIAGAPSGGGDFSVSVSGASSQTILAGGSANFTFTVQPQKGLASPITLAASGLPGSLSASFNPATVPPGDGAATVTLTVSAPQTAQTTWLGARSVCVALLFGLVLPWRRRWRGALLLLPMMMIAGCGDRVYSTAANQSSKSYTITVTGTATGSGGAAIQHSATFTLTVVSTS
ncbi:MAG: Ig-like domain repeat protein [Edaphobacter sp.]|uniref:Ig-like domain repeat protein n=1 Tax=Edaphobacter sp. TaxID=1934404 RepID=UPI00239DA43D|nr:Ig-like domain repeat protein [Edaphobacter sp.]MDE1175104.1 Ig-like domain repeat protein [Edaphobacter sp.]